MSDETEKKPMSEEEAKAAQADLDKRVKGFNEKLLPLLGEFQLGLGALPLILPDGRLSAKPQLFDDKRKVEEKPREEIATP